MDTSDNIYVTGGTGDGFPVTPGTYQFTPGTDSLPTLAYLAKFSPIGQRMYSTVLGEAESLNGGDGPVGPSALAVDANGNAFVAGQAGSFWPITAGAYLSQVESQGGNPPYANPFVTKVSADASTLLYSTFLNYAYQVASIAILPNGNAWIAGSGAEANYPTTTGAYQPTAPSGGSFLTQLDATGSNLVYATFLGDSGLTVNSMALDADGDVWLAAQAANANVPLVAPLQSAFPVGLFGAASIAPFVSQFDPTGKTLRFSSFLGSPANGSSTSVALDAAHRAHVGGMANFGSYTTSGVYAPSVPQPAPGYTGTTYPFVALIDPTVPAPALCVTPNSGIGFYQAGIGNPTDQVLTIQSCGALPLTISTIASASPLFTVPADENKCPQSLPAGQKCSLLVRYTPTAAETDTSTLTITSNAPIPDTLLGLSGIGVPAPVLTLSPGSITFPTQEVGTTSAVQTVTLTNSGTADLSSYMLQLDGNDAASFAQTSTCGAVVPIGQSCSITLTFTPTVVGTASASLDLSSPYSAAQASLTGTAVQTGISIAPQTTGGISATVAAGNPATYNLSLTAANGFSGNISLACTGLPANATCAISPPSFAAASGSTTPFTVTVQTKATVSASLLQRFGLTSAFAAVLVLLPISGRSRRSFACRTLLVLLLAVTPVFSGCGGSSSGGNPVTPTPATVAPGSYTLQIVATSGTTTTTQAVTLMVQ